MLDGVTDRYREPTSARALSGQQGELTCEHRVASGATMEVVDLGGAERSGDRFAERLHGTTIEPSELDAARRHRQVGQASPCRSLHLVVAVTDDERHGGRLGIPRDELKQCERRLVGPL